MSSENPASTCEVLSFSSPLFLITAEALLILKGAAHSVHWHFIIIKQFDYCNYYSKYKKNDRSVLLAVIKSPG